MCNKANASLWSNNANSNRLFQDFCFGASSRPPETASSALVPSSHAGGRIVRGAWRLSDGENYVVKFFQYDMAFRSWFLLR